MLKKDLQIEEIYQRIEQIPKDPRFLAYMCNLIWEKGDEYLSSIKEETCLQKNPPSEDLSLIHTEYGFTSFEYLMWTTSLTSMCWLLTNLKKKIENGHCHNPIHKTKMDQTGRAGCPIGSSFHYSFYNGVIDSLDRLIKQAKENPPMVLDK